MLVELEDLLGVLHQDLVLLLLRHVLERLGHELVGVGPQGGRMGEVGLPHDPVHADELSVLLDG